MISTEAEGE